MKKIFQYFDNVKKEFNKISWPTRDELADNTTITIVFVIFVALFIFGVDQLYNNILTVIYG